MNHFPFKEDTDTNAVSNIHNNNLLYNSLRLQYKPKSKIFKSNKQSRDATSSSVTLT